MQIIFNYLNTYIEDHPLVFPFDNYDFQNLLNFILQFD